MKRSDETIDIELDQKYAMARERKKLKIPEKERKNTDPSLHTQFYTKGLLVVKDSVLGCMGSLASTEKNQF